MSNTPHAATAAEIFEVVGKNGIEPMEVPGFLAGLVTASVQALGNMLQDKCSPTVVVADAVTGRLLLIDNGVMTTTDAVDNVIKALESQRATILAREAEAKVSTKH